MGWDDVVPGRGGEDVEALVADGLDDLAAGLVGIEPALDQAGDDVAHLLDLGRNLGAGRGDSGRLRSDSAQDRRPHWRAAGLQVAPEALGQTDHGLLAHAVNAAAMNQPGQRGRVQHVAFVALLEEDWHERLDTVDHAHQVDARSPSLPGGSTRSGPEIRPRPRRCCR